MTGEVVDPPTKKTITTPLERGLKYGQKYIYKSEKWVKWYGLHSTVEGFNAYIKDPIHTDIEDPGKRRARGNTFAYVVATLVVAAANLRKLDAWLYELARRSETTTSRNRHYRVERFEEARAVTVDPPLARAGSDPPPQ